MRKMVLLVILAALAAATGCSQKGYYQRLTVTPYPAPGVDMSLYKTWNFGRQGEYVMTGYGTLDDPAFRQSVADLVTAELATAGYANTVSSPDMLIMFHLIVEDHYDEVKMNEVYQGYDLAWAQASSEDTWKVGSLAMIVVDAKTGAQVWGSVAKAELDKTATAETQRSRFKDTVKRMIADFPKRPATP